MTMQMKLLPATEVAPSPRTENLSAAQTVAEVVPLRSSGREVHLPPRFAKAAVEAWLKVYKAVGDVIEGPCGPELTGRPLDSTEWAVRLATYKSDPKLHPSDVRRHGDHVVFTFAKNTVALATSQVGWLLRALERVKPEEVDAEGRPLPWVPVAHQSETLGADSGEDDDAVLVCDTEELPPPPVDEPTDGKQPLTNDEIRAWFEKLSLHAGFKSVPLTLTRGRVNKLGFTTGRVWYGRDLVPRRVHLTSCPNSDFAEVLATIVHELAHPLAGTRDHGDQFKEAMITLAEGYWGSQWFAEARNRLSASYHVVDYWVATGIRAALRDGAPPVARTGDDGQMARVVTKIRKLRDLAADQLGLPEAISATATANDLVTVYELGSYRVRLDARIQEQMVDRWVPIKEGAVWRRELAHGVAKASDVFALALVQKSRMHFFGRYADVMQAEYLFEISEARIDRECERHLDVWRVSREEVRAGDLVRERVSFCDSAVRAFCTKLGHIVIEEGAAVGRGRGGTGVKTEALDAAEDFARVEHDKRGMGWRSGGGRTTRDNAAGREVGRSLEVVRGLTTTGGAPKALPGKR